MRSYRLSKKATDSLRTIYLYSARTFGESQADIYFDGLHNAFVRIASHPDIGRALANRQGVRRYVHRRHSIFYRNDGADILILDLLGAGQDPQRHSFSSR